MQLTRRGWAVAASGFTLVVGTFLFAAPELLYGAAALAAVLLGTQFAFVNRLTQLREHVTVTVETSPQTPTVEEDVKISVTVQQQSATLPLRAVLPLPASTVAQESISLDIGVKEQVRKVRTIQSAVAGTYGLGPVRVVATDRLGLFVGTVELPTAASLKIQPRESSDLFLGQGNRRASAAFGEHKGEYARAGIEPAQLRPYQSGDSMRHIDWKATARLDEVYIVEPEVMTDRQTVLLLDSRASMGIGTEPTTPLTYLKHMALAIVGTARDLDDPVGIYTIGDEGVIDAEKPRGTPRQYQLITETIRDLQPTGNPVHSESGGVRTGSGGVRTGPGGVSRTSIRAYSGTSMTRATKGAASLTGDQSQFATTLQPFLAETTRYLHRVDDDPLFATARTYLPKLRGTLWTVIITDDTHREEIRNTVDVARRNNNHVLVILTPSILFEAGGLADLDTVYREYAEFESFRQNLNSIARVEALELAPDDRIETLLAQEGTRR